MPGLPLQTDAFVLLKRPPSDAFQGFNVFSAEHGPLLVHQRLARKAAATSVALDLFDEVSLRLESSNQGQTWFVIEARLLTRHANLGRSYETLRHASALATLVARNSVHEESRAQVATLLRSAYAAFAAGAPPDIVWLKSLYLFARDEGYPVKQEWLPSLTAELRAEAERLLHTPLARLAKAEGENPKSEKLSAEPPVEDPEAGASSRNSDIRLRAAATALLITRLELYLRGHTEVLLD